MRPTTDTDTFRITLLAENTARGRGILGEHGLSYWIEAPGGRVLFDTGQGLVLRANAERLGIELSSATDIVLSHGHYDHVGGLESALALAPQARLHFHPAARTARFSADPGGAPRRADTPFFCQDGPERAGARLHPSASAVEILPHLWSTGAIPRLTDYEDVGGLFFLDAAGREADPIADDQSLFLLTGEGVVLILGCAHAGVVNTLLHVRALTGNLPLRAVIGGMHLLHADENRIRKTLEAFRAAAPALLSPCHCTGIAAVTAIQQAFPRAFVEAHAGKQYAFPCPSCGPV